VIKRMAAVVLTGLALGVGVLVADSPPTQRELGKARKAKVGTAHEAVLGSPVTITYDTGVNFAFFAGGGGRSVGNRFNSRLMGPLVMTGQVTMVTIFPQLMGGAAGTAAFVTIFSPPTGGGMVFVLPSTYNSVNAMGLMSNQFNAVTLPIPITVGPDFLGGLYCQGVGGDNIGLGDMSVSGQGFHAFQLMTNYMYGSGYGFAVIPARNALYRVSGNPLPVELMTFDVN